MAEYKGNDEMMNYEKAGGAAPTALVELFSEVRTVAVLRKKKKRSNGRQRPFLRYLIDSAD